MSAPLNSKLARELVEAYQSIYASSVEKEMVDQEVDINEDAASMMSGSNTERQKQINKSGGRDTGLTAKIGTAVRNWLNPPRSQSADPVVRRGGSYTGPGGAPEFPDKSPAPAPRTAAAPRTSAAPRSVPGGALASKDTSGAQRRTPTTAELRAAQAARAAGKSEKDVVKAGIAAGKPKSVATRPAVTPPPPVKKSRLDTALSGIGKWNEEVSPYDMVLDYLISEGHVASVEEAHHVMLELDKETIQDICKSYFDEGIFSGLPKSTTVIPPSGRSREGIRPRPSDSGSSITVTQTRRPTSKTPFSKTDSGNLTDFGAGGGKEKMKRTGMSVGQVERLGRKNLGKRLPQIDDIE